ncbi:TPA: hypothetical protein KKL86_004835, partial [Escherichia coli]|nr:hypothetical protein [Escherichia coli]
GQYGEVEDAFIPTDRMTGRPRGFAFVTMPEDAADTAERETNETEFLGRTLRVNEAAARDGPRPERTERSYGEDAPRERRERPAFEVSEGMKKLYVANLSYDATKEDLQDFFEQWGQVESVTLPMERDTGRMRGFGFVTMAEEGAERAIEEANESDFMGRTIMVSESNESGRSGGGGGGGGRGGGRGYGGGGGRGYGGGGGR